MDQNDRPGDGDENDSNGPTLADRVEASDDFRGALEQSTELAMDHRRLLLILVLGSLLLTAVLIAYPYLF